ncbi:unnamed protein product [Closterium sp. Naga37s-1]|nr:unnamed protein product [Closterium sp. Naga37s-1]
MAAAAASAALGDLLLLQGQAKRDPEGYREEFERQHRHYRALLAVFSLKPHAESKEFGDLVMFLAQLAPFYRSAMGGFPGEVMGLLQSHVDVLHPMLRRQLAHALILLRNRQLLGPTDLIPHFFRLFRCPDKALRKLVFAHIVNDIRRLNQKHRHEGVNRPIQNMLFSLVQEENEMAAKKSLAVLIELYRRKVWTDARTVNVIATACLHPCTRIMVGALKFFMGADRQGEGEDGSSDEEEDEEEKKNRSKENSALALDRKTVYTAYLKGIPASKRKKQVKLKRVMKGLRKQQQGLLITSKRKKQAKLKRVMKGLRKQQRAVMGGGGEGTGEGEGNMHFAALHLLHDPQGFAEKLFSRVSTCNEKFEVKLLMLNVVSRVIGTHRLLLLNFYPFLQRYLMPHQRDVTHLLAIAVQACHDLVPPDAVESMVKQTVNLFVHDRARPEVIAVGLNAVREVCARMPLVMGEELLQDLAMYKKAREKAVAAAARSIISLFREVNPSLLQRKDRGKPGKAGEAVQPVAFGHVAVSDHVPGIELLGIPEEEGNGEEGESEEGSEEGSEGESEEEGGEESEEEVEGSDEEMEEGEEGEEGEEVEGDSDEEGSSGSEEVESEGEEEEGEEEEEEMEQDRPGISRKRKAEGEASGDGKRKREGPVKVEGASLRQLKRLAAQGEEKAGEEAGGGKAGEKGEGEEEEKDGFLSTEDFRKIRRMQAKQAAESMLRRKGMKKAANALAHSHQARSHSLSDRRVDASDLEVSCAEEKEESRGDDALAHMHSPTCTRPHALAHVHSPTCTLPRALASSTLALPQSTHKDTDGQGGANGSIDGGQRAPQLPTHPFIPPHPFSTNSLSSTPPSLPSPPPQVHIKARRDKEERMAAVLAGREDRSFFAKSKMKQQKHFAVRVTIKTPIPSSHPLLPLLPSLSTPPSAPSIPSSHLSSHPSPSSHRWVEHPTERRRSARQRQWQHSGCIPSSWVLPNPSPFTSPSVHTPSSHPLLVIGACLQVGGTSNREKEKRKAAPMAAQRMKLKRRTQGKRRSLAMASVKRTVAVALAFVLALVAAYTAVHSVALLAPTRARNSRPLSSQNSLTSESTQKNSPRSLAPTRPRDSRSLSSKNSFIRLFAFTAPVRNPQSSVNDAAIPAVVPRPAPPQLQQQPAIHAPADSAPLERVCGSPAVDGYAHVNATCLEASPTNRMWWSMHPQGGRSGEGLDCHMEREVSLDGLAVRWGIGHKTTTPEQCCQACRDHRPDPQVADPFAHLPCNVWVFCCAPTCFEPDAHTHTFGDCWLKFSEAPQSPEVNARGEYPRELLMAALLHAIWVRYLDSLKHRPVLTKALTSASLAAVSDLMAQRLASRKPVELRRTILMWLFGLLYMGPSAHMVHRALDAIFAAKRDTKTALKKVVVEQLTYGPCCNVVAIMWIAYVVERRSWMASKRRLFAAYPGIQINGWKVWPLVALINYKFIPFNLRVLFSNVIAIFWSTFLILKARGIKDKQSLE